MFVLGGRGMPDSLIFVLSATGGFVDQAGVALTNGGGTLVLGTHDSVRAARRRAAAPYLY